MKDYSYLLEILDAGWASWEKSAAEAIRELLVYTDFLQRELNDLWDLRTQTADLRAERDAAIREIGPTHKRVVQLEADLETAERALDAQTDFRAEIERLLAEREQMRDLLASLYRAWMLNERPEQHKELKKSVNAALAAGEER